MQKLKSLALIVATICEYLAIAGVSIMVLINCADVFGSKLFSKPVPGSTELISVIQLATLAFALGATQMVRGHINVEMFVLLLNEKKRAMMLAFTTLLELITFVLLGYEAVLYGNSLKMAGEVSGTIRIPFFSVCLGSGILLCPGHYYGAVRFLRICKGGIQS